MKNLAIIAGAAAILSGCCSCPQPCASLVNRPNDVCPCDKTFCSCAPTHVPQVNTYTKAESEILDGFLAQWVPVVKFNCTKSNDGHEKVQASLKNVTGLPILVSYKFDWYNAQGERVEDMYNGTFKRHTLKPGDDGTLTSIAPSQDCVDFKLRIKYAQ